MLHKNNIALFIAILFHASGAIGIIASPYRDWFIQASPFTLLLMAGLLLWTQPEKNKNFFLFALICFAVGLAAEITGVNTQLLFGNYKYGDVLGYKIAAVPVIIGVNWFTIVFCAGTIVHRFSERVFSKMPESQVPSGGFRIFYFVFDAATLAVLFDWVIEPVAPKLGYWQWLPDGKLPVYNYFCWYIISAALLWLFQKMQFSKQNQFAVHLFIIQILFFLSLRIFL